MFLAVVIRGKSYNPTNMVAFELELGGYQDTAKKKKKKSLHCFTLREKWHTVPYSVPTQPKLSEEYLQHWHFPLYLKITI